MEPSRSRPIAAARAALALAALLSVAATPAHAQEQRRPDPEEALIRPPGAAAEVVTRGEADEAVRRGVRIKPLLHRPVHGRGGEEVGELKDILIAGDGAIEAIVVEAGGVAGLAAASVRIPWAEVEVGDGGRIVADVRGEELPDFAPFGADKVEPGPRAFRASEFLGSYVRLRDGETLGRVADAAFDPERGRVTAVVVEPAYGYRERYGSPVEGLLAYPYHGFDPGRGYYELPDTAAEARRPGPLDFEAMGVQRYREVEVDAARGELVIEQQTGGDKEQPGNAAGIHIDR